jgi:hypothetical protein
MNNALIKGLATVSIAFMTQYLQAAEIIQTRSFSADQGVSFDLFDPALGTLNDVAVTIDSNISATLTAEFSSSPEGPEDFAIIRAEFFGREALGRSNYFDAIVFGIQESITLTFDQIVSGDWFALSSYTPNLNDWIIGSVLPANSLFVRTADVGLEGGCGTIATCSGSSAWSGDFTLTYTFEEARVPVPATLILVMVGAAGVSFHRRKSISLG